MDEAIKAEIRRLEAIIAGQERAVTLLGTANQIAQDKFEQSVAARFAQVNEFRASLDDLSQKMATRRELEATQTVSQGRWEDLIKQLGDLRSRLDVGPAALTDLRTRADISQGRQQGVQTLGANLYLLLGAVAAIAAIIGHFAH